MTVESGKMTKDLALLVKGNKLEREDYLNTEEFLAQVEKQLIKKLTTK